MSKLEFAPEFTQVQIVGSSATPSLQARMLFCRLATIMIRSGIGIHKAIDVAGQESADPAMQKTSMVVSDLIYQGASLPEAINSCPNMFSALHIGLIRGNEATGSYEVALAQIAETDSMLDAMHKRLLVALIQPITILSGLFIFAVVAPKVFIPQVRAMVADFGAEMPWFSRWIFGIFEVFGSPWFWVGVAVLAAAIIRFKRESLFRKEVFQRKISSLCYRIPWLSTVLRSVLQAHWARIISMQLAAGVNLIQALKCIRHGLNDPVFHKACTGIEDGVKGGQTISDAMESTGYFDRVVIGMTRVGEENGNLSEMLDFTARFYEEELLSRLDTFEQLLTPVLLTLAGVIVGAWVIAVILPLSNLIGSMGS